MLVLLLIVQSAWALPVTGLYSHRVAVANESEAERSRAFSEALAAVVLKVSGDRRWLQQPQVEAAVRNAQAYVEAIAYSSETLELPVAGPADEEELTDEEEVIPTETAAGVVAPAADETDAESPPPAIMTIEQRYITVNFDAGLIDEMLTQSGIPVWDSNRPSVLVWMVLQDANGDRRMLSTDSSPEIIDFINEFGAERGVPIIFPLLDFVDRQALSEDEVWRLEEEEIRQASARYGADSVLAARLHFTASGELVGLWQFLFRDEAQTFDGFATELRDYLGGPLDRITNQLANYFAITPEASVQLSVQLRVDGVSDLADYSALMSYLGGLGLVEQVTTAALDGERIELRLALLGDRQQLAEQIALDRDLLPVGTAAVDPGRPLHYRWTR